MTPWPTRAALLVCGLIVVSACTTTDVNVARFERAVSPIQTDETADVPALVLARAMAETGFSREDILEYGPAIRNAIARSGGAQITNGSNTLAMVSVMDGRLFIVSNENGTAVIPISGYPG